MQACPQIYLSLLVCPTFGLLAMFSFEFALLSMELIDKFSFIGIFFRVVGRWPFFVCLLLLAGKQAIVFLVICCCLQR